jgi:hypothetical protein
MTNNTIDNLYAEFCVELRRLKLEHSQGIWKCDSCERFEKDHHYDGKRCTLYATSPNFRASERSGRLVNVERALGLIEELKSLPAVVIAS